MADRYTLDSRIVDVLAGRGDGSELLYHHGYWLGEGFVDMLSQFQTLEDASREGRLRNVHALIAELNSASKE